MAGQGHRVVLCADDFGLTEGVSQGILDLIRMGRLSATSAMTNMAWWPRLAPELKACAEGVGVGLHLNLTTGRPLGPMPVLAPGGVFPRFPTLLPRTLLGHVHAGEIREEIERQLNAFEAAFGRPPDYVDGHQHVHVLPGVRAALLMTLKRRALAGRVWLRDPSDTVRAIARRRVSARKALVVRGLATGFRGAARRAGFATNEGFSGFSAFDPGGNVERAFHRYVLKLGERPVIMCHPGYVDDELPTLDPVVEPRSQELIYLSSGRFLDLIETLGITLVPKPTA